MMMLAGLKPVRREVRLVQCEATPREDCLGQAGLMGGRDWELMRRGLRKLPEQGECSSS